MSLNDFNSYLAMPKQRVPLQKTASRTALIATQFSVLDVAGNPGPGTLPGANNTNGVVPTSATAGYPPINTFGLGNTGYLTRVEYWSAALARLALYDTLFKVGAISYAGGTTTLSSQPSYSARLPNTDYKGLEIHLEVSTAFLTGNNWQVQVGYTNQDGVSGRLTEVTAAKTAAQMILGRKMNIGLQAGDSGVQKIDSVIVTNGSTSMTAGAFNILVMRRLWTNRVSIANGASVDDLLKTGGPVVYADSALTGEVTSDSVSTGAFEITAEIANG